MERDRRERGSVLIMVVLALGIFLIGAIGLGIDGSRLYAERQMAQAAADAAAQAAMMSVFDGTNTIGNAHFDAARGSSFPCLVASKETPCVYAQMNGFGTAKDTVVIDFPDSSAVPGVNLWIPPDPTMPNLARATVTRVVDTTLMRFLGPSTSTIKAIGIAGILAVWQAPPILVLDPTAAGALSLGGNATITVEGGPSKSIQVNSSSANAVDCQKPLTLSGDLGAWGGPHDSPCTINGVGEYVQPASIIPDPLADVPAPSQPSPAPASCKVGSGDPGCPVGQTFGCPGCTLFFPGAYTTFPNVKHYTAAFMPGLYYIKTGGLSFDSNSGAQMATGVPADPSTGNGMVMYFAGNGGVSAGSNAGDIYLVGAPIDSIYKGILFFGRDAGSGADFGGGGNISLTGTIYFPNASMSFHGNSSTDTLFIGEIIVGNLSLQGTPKIKMQLNAAPSVFIRQVALVK